MLFLPILWDQFYNVFNKEFFILGNCRKTMVEAFRNNLHWSLWENQVIASLVFQIPNCTAGPRLENMSITNTSLQTRFVRFLQSFCSSEGTIFLRQMCKHWDSIWLLNPLGHIGLVLHFQFFGKMWHRSKFQLCNYSVAILSPSCGFSASSLWAPFSLLVELHPPYNWQIHVLLYVIISVQFFCTLNFAVFM